MSCSRFSRLVLIGAGVTLVFAPFLACGQDTRTVTEPKFPPACTVLNAEKLGYDDSFSAEVESATDTVLIHKALDGSDAINRALRFH
jgi:hypothetical protein